MKKMAMVTNLYLVFRHWWGYRSCSDWSNNGAIDYSANFGHRKPARYFRTGE